MAWTWSLAPDTAGHADQLQLTDAEMCLLAKFEFMQETSGCPTIAEVCRKPGATIWEMGQRSHEAYLSLCRFAYIVQAHPREVRHASVVDTLSTAGRERLLGMSARSYRCCSFAIRLPCVCTEKTYCPNPEHVASNGCHGTHD